MLYGAVVVLVVLDRELEKTGQGVFCSRQSGAAPLDAKRLSQTTFSPCPRVLVARGTTEKCGACLAGFTWKPQPLADRTHISATTSRNALERMA